MIKVQTLGSAEISIGEHRLTPRTEVMFCLALFIALHPGERLARDRLADMFWPGSDAERGRHNLRQMLYRLRQVGFPLDEDPLTIGIARADVAVDLDAILADAWPTGAANDDILAASTFLPLLEPDLGERFATWLSGLRSQVAQQLRRAVIRQLDTARQEARWLDLERWSDVLLTSDPLNEEGTLAKAESIAMTGSKALAIELLDTYLEEIGSKASSITLPAQVLRRRISERTLDWGNRQSAEVPFVGRHELVRRLTAFVDATETSSTSVLLHGAAGIGKTRLCLEIRNYAVMRGMWPISVRADDVRTGRPLGIVMSLAAQVKETPGSAGAAPMAMAVISRLLDATTESASSSRTANEGLHPDHIAWALADLLAAAGGEKRILIHLDDLHNADDASLDILRRLLQRVCTPRLLLIATARSSWLSSVEGDRWQSTPINRVRVTPLSPTEAAEYAAALLRLQPVAQSSGRELDVVSVAGGNPLLIRELLATRPQGTARQNRSVTLASVIALRCSQLSSREIRLLRVTSLLGPFATLATLQRVANLESDFMADTIEGLELDGLVRLDERGVLLLHECWRDAIDSETGQGTRAALALECARALESGDGEPFLNSHWHRGHLYSMASSFSDAARCYTGAGEQLASRGAAHAAAAAFRAALEFASDGLARLMLFRSLANSQLAGHEFASATATCTTALSTIPATDSTMLGIHAELTAVLAESQWKAHNTGVPSLNLLAEMASRPGVPSAQRNICCYTGIRISCVHDGLMARQFLDALDFTSDQAPDDWPALATLLIFHAEFGDPAEVRSVSSALDSVLYDRLPLFRRAVLLRHRGMAMRFLGDPDEAARLAGEAARIAATAGLLSNAAATAISLVFTHLDNNQPEKALDWLERAREWNAYAAHDERDRSFRHAHSRYLLLTQNFDECFGLQVGAFESISRDPMRLRRAGEAACLAYSAARTAHHDVAVASADIAIEVLRDVAPSFTLDFVADSLIGALPLLGRERMSSELRADYLARRKRSFDRPIASAFARLRTN